MATTGTDGGRRSLDPFAFAVGLYVALLLLPPVLAALDRAGLTTALLEYVTTVTTLGLVTVVVWAGVARFGDARSRLAASRSRLLPPLPPFGYVVAGYALLDGPGRGVLWLFVGLAATLVGLWIWVLARSRQIATIVAGSERYGAVPVTWTAETQRRRRHVGVVTVVVGVAATLWGIIRGYDWLDVWLLVMIHGQLGGLSLMTGFEGRVTATSAGLQVGRSTPVRLLRWDGFAGYTRTDDALVLHRSWLPDLRLVLADLDDSDDVVARIVRHFSAA